ncbi:hypothetical protein ACFP3Q_05770 [Nocardioides sp. GCM10027113]|uniref:hypothetical protein n=1 Tax=unclassified Nocardioides TaxID=2615069 RepID=UPI003609A23D
MGRALRGRIGNRIGRAALVAGLAAAGLAGCGSDGGSSAPDNASTEDFCGAYLSVFDDMDFSEVPSDEEAAEMMRQWGDRLAEVGTPEDMSEEARDGFELVVDTLGEIDADTSAQDIEDLGEDWSEEQDKAGEAFSQFVAKECPMEIPGMEDLEKELGDLEGELGDLESQLEDQMGELEGELEGLTESP